MTKLKWQVAEHVGTDKEVIVSEHYHYLDACKYISDNYPQEERVSLGVDILKEGVTEY